MAIEKPVKIKNPIWAEIWDTVKFIIILMIIVVPFRMYIAQPFIVSGSSMDPTFADRQYLIVDEISYALGKIKRGDVVIFHPPAEEKSYYIKRIIGLPNERVTIQNGRTIIYNEANPNGLELDDSFIKKNTTCQIYCDVQLGADEFFVMGDNRTNSQDSRIIGPIPRSNLVGRAFARLFPFNTMVLFPGEEEM
jgi:signal peptidase I, bacterial type